MAKTNIDGLDELNDLYNKLRNLEKTPLSQNTENKILGKIGSAWEGQIRFNIKNGVDYNGFPLLKPKNREGQPLLDTGRLISSINHKVYNSTLSIGTPVYYSKWLNEGTSKMKERPFIPQNTSEIPEKWWKIANKLTIQIAIEDLKDSLK